MKVVSGVVLFARDWHLRQLLNENLARIHLDEFAQLFVVDLWKGLVGVESLGTGAGQQISESVCKLGVENSNDFCVAVV